MGLEERTRQLYGRVRQVARSFMLVSVPDHPENGGLTGDEPSTGYEQRGRDGDDDRRE